MKKHSENKLLLFVILVVTALIACSIVIYGIHLKRVAAPSIKIIVPRDDPEAAGLPVEGLCPVLVEVSNFRLVDNLGGSNAPSEGHIHYFLDVEPPTEPGRPAITSTGTYADSSETIHYWPDIGRGPHTFWVELVNNDHTPLNPLVIAKASVTAGIFGDG